MDGTARMDGIALTENVDVLSGLALLTRRQYETFLDQPSSVKKIGYMLQKSDERERSVSSRLVPDRLMPLRRPRDKIAEERLQDEKRVGPKTMLTTLRSGGGQPGPDGLHLKGCKILAKDGHAAWWAALMQCGVVVFDITGGTDDELREARGAFGYVLGELMKCGEEELMRWRDEGTVRHFVLISSAMTWVEESRDRGGGGGGGEEESGNDGHEFGRKNVLGRMPATQRYRTVFELEKMVLRANVLCTKDVFHGHVIGAGLTYGHEQYALRHVFGRAWSGGRGMCAPAAGPRFSAVPAIHVDELAELLRTLVSDGTHVRDNNEYYALAVERPSYGFADIVNAVRDEFCGPDSRRPKRVPVEHDRVVADRYGLADGFALDLIRCGDLAVDPMTLEDAVPGYRAHRAPLVADVRRLAREYVAARVLRPMRVLVTGRSRAEVARVAERLARRYRVPLVNRRRAVDHRVDRLRDELNDALNRREHVLRASARRSRPPDDIEWSAAEEYVQDNEPTVSGEMLPRRTSYSLENELAESAESENSTEDVDYDDDDDGNEWTADLLPELDREIGIVQSALADLDVDCNDSECIDHANHCAPGRDADGHDPHGVLPLIRQLLCSCACRHRGYVLDLYPLTVERLDQLFDGDAVGCPNTVVMLSSSYDSDDPSTVPSADGIDDRDAVDRLNWDRSECDIITGYANDNRSPSAEWLRDDGGGGGENFDYAADETNVYGTAANAWKSETVQKRVVDYFANRRAKVLRLNVPSGGEPAVQLGTSDSPQYVRFMDSITAQIGRAPVTMDDDYDDDTEKSGGTSERAVGVVVGSTVSREKTRSAALKKLNSMKAQWNSSVHKTMERDKLHEYSKTLKVQNYVITDVLPRLLKEISPVGRNVGADVPVSKFPEDALNKSKLCRTRPYEN